MRKQIVDFRTPQHPSAGNNNWGGASPLLARNIPQESLEIRYLRLNTIRARDEIFPAEDDFINLPRPLQPSASKIVSPRLPQRNGGMFSKFMWYNHKEKTENLGNNGRRRWFPRWDPRKRWPQGWC